MSTASAASTSIITADSSEADKIFADGRRILEDGNLVRFKDYVHSMEKKSAPTLFNMAVSFQGGGFTFPIILVQTFHKMQAIRGKSHSLPVDDYVHCLKWMLRKGAQINGVDHLQRTVAHWSVLTQSHDMLRAVLKENCDPLLQDVEGQTVAHLALRIGCSESLKILHETLPDSQVLTEPSSTSGATPLIYAVQIGSEELVEQLLSYNIDVNQCESNKYKRTALHYALYTKSVKLFEILLRFDARADIADYKDRSVEVRVAENADPLFAKLLRTYRQSSDDTNDENANNLSSLLRACQEEDDELVSKILENSKEAALNAIDDSGKTALHFCVEHQRLDCANHLLSKAPELTKIHDNDGFTALHLATIVGNTDLISALLQHGADVDAVDKDLHTCVHWAVVSGQIKALNVLIEKSAKMTLPDIYGATPLHYAAQLVTESDNQIDANNQTNGGSGLDILRLLLTCNLKVDALDRERRTALLWASSTGNVEACRILLSAGASLRRNDKAGLNALHCAASRGHENVVRFLINEGTKTAISTPGSSFSLLNICDRNECTALFYAVTANNEECVRALLELGADPNHQDIKGRSPIHCAAAKGHGNLINILCEKNANLWLHNTTGDTALHEAVNASNFDVVKVLVEHPTAAPKSPKKVSKKKKKKKVDEGEENLEEVRENVEMPINAVNRLGQSALHLAAVNNDAKICNMLLRHGADVNQETTLENGRMVTPFDLTTHRDCQDILQRYNGSAWHELHGGPTPPPEIYPLTLPKLQEEVKNISPNHRRRKSPRKASVKDIDHSDSISNNKVDTSPSKVLNESGRLPLSTNDAEAVENKTDITLPVANYQLQNVTVEEKQRSSLIDSQSENSVPLNLKNKSGNVILVVNSHSHGNSELGSHLVETKPHVADKETSLMESNREEINSLSHSGKEVLIENEALKKSDEKVNRRQQVVRIAEKKTSMASSNNDLGHSILQVNESALSRQTDDTESIPSVDSVSLPDPDQDQDQEDNNNNNKNSLAHSPPRRVRKLTRYPTARVKKNVITKEASSLQTATRIQSSVSEYERLKNQSRDLHMQRKAKIHGGYVADRSMMLALMDEYRRTVLQGHVSNENGTDFKENDDQSLNDNQSLQMTEVDNAQNESTATATLTPHSTNELNPDDLNSILKDTKALYEQVQRQADETLHLARLMNTKLRDEMQRARINANVKMPLAGSTMGNLSTAARSPRPSQKPFNTSSLRPRTAFVAYPALIPRQPVFNTAPSSNGSAYMRSNTSSSSTSSNGGVRSITNSSNMVNQDKEFERRQRLQNAYLPKIPLSRPKSVRSSTLGSRFGTF